MRAMPLVGIATADARKIRAGAFGSPLKGMIVHALGCEAIMTIALHFVAKRTDHLRVTDVTAFLNVDFTSGEFERRIRAYALDTLDRRVDEKKRRDLHNAADRNDNQNADQQNERMSFEPLMKGPHARLAPNPRPPERQKP